MDCFFHFTLLSYDPSRFASAFGGAIKPVASRWKKNPVPMTNHMTMRTLPHQHLKVEASHKLCAINHEERDAAIARLTHPLLVLRARRSGIMSFTDSIMIASSPAPLFLAQNLAQRSNAARLSSPIFPSPSQFFATKQLSLESDERVVSNSKSGVNRLTDGLTLPDQAPPSLQLRKSLMEDRENAKEIEISQGSILQSTKSKTSAVKKKEGSIDRRKKKVPKKKPEKSVENDVIVLEDDGSQRSAQQSKNSKNSNVEVQSKMKKGKITKPGVIGDLVVKKRKSISSAENVDQDDQISSEIPLKKKTKKITATKEPLDLQLAKSIKRRKDWTPTKDTPVQDVLVENLSSVSGETLSSDRSVILNQPTSGFDNLLNEFGYAKTSEEMSLNVESIEPMNNDALTKGHKIEVSHSLCEGYKQLRLHSLLIWLHRFLQLGPRSPNRPRRGLRQ